MKVTVGFGTMLNGNFADYDYVYDTLSQAMLKGTSKQQFLEVARLDEKDVPGMLNSLLASVDRCLTIKQHDIITKAVINCPSPLYLKLCVDEAARYVLCISDLNMIKIIRLCNLCYFIIIKLLYFNP